MRRGEWRVMICRVEGWRWSVEALVGKANAKADRPFGPSAWDKYSTDVLKLQEGIFTGANAGASGCASRSTSETYGQRRGGVIDPRRARDAG